MIAGPSRRLLLPLAAYKLVLLGVALGSFALLPPSFEVGDFRGNFHWPPGAPITLLTTLQTWDAQHFLFLSQHGYQRLPPEQSPFNAFYPLWPAAIRAGSSLLSPLASALVLSNLFSLLGLVVFHDLVARLHGEEAAGRSLLLLLAFPSAFVLCLPYSESLFLLLSASFLWCLFAGRTLGVAATSFLLPLTRASGVFMALPLLVHVAWQERRPARLWLLAMPLLGFASYLGILSLTTGDPFTGFRVYQHYAGRAAVSNLWDLPALWRAFAPAGGLAPHALTNSALDRCVFVVVLAMLPLVARLGPTWLAYALVAGVLPAAANSFMSYTRYALLALPVFVAAALHLGGARQAWLAVVAGGSFGLQLLLLLRHVNARWAG